MRLRVLCCVCVVVYCAHGCLLYLSCVCVNVMSCLRLCYLFRGESTPHIHTHHHHHHHNTVVHARTTTTTGVPPTHPHTRCSAIMQCNAAKQQRAPPFPQCVGMFVCRGGGRGRVRVWCGMVPPPQLHPTRPRSRHLTLPYVFVLIGRVPSERGS